MDDGIDREPVVRIQILPGNSKPRYVSKNAAVMSILDRVRSTLYIVGEGRESIVTWLSELPEDEQEALVAELTSTLNSAYYVQRANAIFVLGLLGTRARPAIRAIVQSMNVWNCKVTMAAAEALPKIDAIEAATALANGFNKIPSTDSASLSWCNQDESIVQCLEALGPSAISAAPNLCAYLHFMGRTNHALISMGADAIPYVLTEVRRASSKRLPQICRNAAEIFSAIGTDACQPLIDALLCLQDDRLRMAMIFSFLEPPALTEDAREPLRRLLSDASVKAYAEQALAKLDAQSRAKVSANGMLSRDAVSAVLSAVRSGRYIFSKNIALASMTDAQKVSLVGSLIEYVKSFKQSEQVNAIYVLGLLGQQASPATADIVKALDRMDCAAVIQAADTLLKIGAAYAVPELIAELPAEAQRMTVTGLSRTQERAIECLELFSEYFRDSFKGLTQKSFSSHLPFLAAFLATRSVNTLLATIGPAAIPAIIDEVRRAAVRKKLTWTCPNAAIVLTAIGAPASQPLNDALVASTPETREAFSLVFSTLKPPALSISAAPILSGSLLDYSSGRNVSSNARLALIALGGEAAPAVVDHLGASLARSARGQTNESRMLDELLARYGESAIPSLVEHMPHKDPMSQANLASAILRMDAYNKDAAEILLTLLKSDDAKVRANAVWAVADSHKQGPVIGLVNDLLLPLVKRAWHDRDANVRKAASSVLQQLLTSEGWHAQLASVSVARSKREIQIEKMKAEEQP